MSSKSQSQNAVLHGWLLGTVLFVLTLVAYLPVMVRGGYLWDDDDYLTKNVLVQKQSGLEGIWGEPSKSPQYYPMVFSMFWVERHWWGSEAAGYHVVNVILHGVSVVLLWRVLVRLRVRGAVLAAAIFAVHPVLVESVAWITERKNVLCGVFYLGAMWCYLRFALPAEEGEARQEWGFYGGAILLFVLALLSKSVACSFPAAVLILLWYRRVKIGWREVGLVVPFFVLGALAALNTMHLEKTRVGAFGAEWDFSWGERVLIAGRAFWFYLGKLVVPWKLTFIYPRWEVRDAAWWAWGFPVATVCAVAGCVVAAKWIGRGVATGVLFFVVTIFPALGFTNIFPMRYTFVADHYQYMACVGVLVLIGAGMAWVGATLNGRTRVLVAGVIVAGLAVLTGFQCLIYQNERMLWTDTIEKNPTAWIAYDNRGILETNEEQFSAAQADFEASRKLRPERHVELYMALGNLYFKQGRFAEAVPMLEETLRQEGDVYFKALAENMLGAIAIQEKDFQKAAGCFEASVKYSPTFAEGWLNLQQVEMMLGNNQRSREAGEKVLELDKGE